MWFFYALVFAVATAIFLSLIKHLTKTFHPLTLIVINHFFALPCIAILILYLGGVPSVTPKFYFLMINSAVLDAVAFAALFYALSITSVSLLSPFASFNPIVTLIIASITLHEIPSFMKLLGVVTIVVGSYLLNIKDIQHGLLQPFKKLFVNKGVQLFLLANVLWGITPTFQKPAIFETQPQMALYPSFIGGVFVTLLLLPFVIKKLPSHVPLIKNNLTLFIFFGIMSAISQYAAFTAFSLAPVGYVTAIFKTSILFSILLGWLFFKEERISERLLGASVMIIGMLLLVV